MFWLTSIVLTFSLGRLSACGAVSEGGACSTKNDRIDPNTRKFMSDCNDQTYCNAMTNGTCQARQCRKDEFPFGYGLGDTIPPLCSRGSFCPDSGSGCQPLRQAGQSCELNRDDQCAPAPNWQQLASSQNTDGSLCLQTTCIFANASIGQSCIIDETTYIDTGAGGQQYSNVIVRHNCETPHLYCDRTHLQCFKAKPIGISCSSDEECSSLNCNSGVCSDPPGTPLQVAPWQYAAISSGVFAAMITILTLLILVHKRLRLRHYRAVREYYDEQLSLRESLVALHAAAAERYSVKSAKGR